jgi:hypothetical protein
LPRIYVLHLTALGLSAIHHVDHILRGTHVGWPMTSEVTPFTYTLAIYPIIALGFVFRSRLYWLAAASGGLLLLTVVHFGPFAVESPADIVGAYSEPLAGSAALAVLLGLLAVLVLIVAFYLRPGLSGAR